MLGVFISSFDEASKQVFKDFISFVEVSPTASETAMEALAERLKEQDMDIKQIHLLVFMVPNSMSGKPKVIQQRIKNYASRAIYINYRYHHLNLLLIAK